MVNTKSNKISNLRKEKPGLKPFKNRVQLLVENIREAIKDPMFPTLSLMGNIEEELSLYKYSNLNDLINGSLKKGNVRWRYTKHNAFFISDEKTIISLVLPDKGFIKYIHGKNNNDGRDVIVALPLEFHRHIVGRFEEQTGVKLYNIRGGYMRLNKKPFSKPTLILGGFSVDFGRAHHEQVAKILSSYGFNVKLNR